MGDSKEAESLNDGEYNKQVKKVSNQANSELLPKIGFVQQSLLVISTRFPRKTRSYFHQFPTETIHNIYVVFMLEDGVKIMLDFMLECLVFLM